jgi:hypothetical protein
LLLLKSNIIYRQFWSRPLALQPSELPELHEGSMKTVSIEPVLFSQAFANWKDTTSTDISDRNFILNSF